MMRRAVKVLGLLALAPILMGGGGINPAPPGAKIAKSPKFRATIVVDPHAAIGDEFGAVQANATTTAKQATIQLREEKKGELLYQAQFKVLPGFPFYLGCDPSLSAGRFLYTPQNGNLLAHWVPPAALTFLFASQGIAVSPTNEPAITQIVSNRCVDDSQNPAPQNPAGSPPSAPALPDPGILVLDVVIQFQIL
jgi:hypothetical protein